MKTKYIVLAIVLGVTGAHGQEGPTTQKQQYSYAVGFQFAMSIKQRQELDLDVAAFTQAIQDVLNGVEPKLSMQEMQGAVTMEQQKVATAQAERATKNQTAGREFLEQNKQREQVKVTTTGLQYEVLQQGSGRKPKATDTVVVHYRGMLLNGEEFDSSYKRDQPTTLPLSGVIPGWREALQLMSEGGKWKLFIPGDLAYGDRGAGGRIGPHETLVFEVELISVK